MGAAWSWIGRGLGMAALWMGCVLPAFGEEKTGPERRFNALMDAIRADREDRVAGVLESGPVAVDRPLATADNRNITPLMIAAAGAGAPVVRLLVEHNASVTMDDER